MSDKPDTTKTISCTLNHPKDWPCSICNPQTTAHEANDTLKPVVLSASRWKRITACLDWHGKDHESELIVDAIREQTGDD